MALLRVAGLSVSVGGREIVRDLSFDVNEGDCLAITGRNGSGKTVLIKALLGILPHRGDIVWRDGVRIGYVPQKIEADRGIPITIRNLFDAKKRVTAQTGASALHSFLPAALLDRPIGQLSGGQFQRGLIAFALIGKPAVLLLDEPTASIDQEGEQEIYDALDHLRREHAITLLVVTHDQTYVHRYASRVLEMRAP